MVDFEIRILVHDDASTDETGDLLQTLAKRSPFPFEIVRPEVNQYQFGSGFKFRLLQRGFSPYICTLDADDYWIDNSKIAKQVALMESSPTVSLCHSAYEVRRKSKLIETVRYAGPNRIDGRRLADGNFIGTSSVMLRRNSLPEKLPDGFNKVRGIDDWPIWALASQNSLIAYLDEPMSVYWLHSHNHFANQDLDKKKYQSLIALVYITNSVDEEFQPIWLSALEKKFLHKTSPLGKLAKIRSMLFG